MGGFMVWSIQIWLKKTRRISKLFCLWYSETQSKCLAPNLIAIRDRIYYFLLDAIESIALIIPCKIQTYVALVTCGYQCHNIESQDGLLRYKDISISITDFKLRHISCDINYVHFSFADNNEDLPYSSSFQRNDWCLKYQYIEHTKDFRIIIHHLPKISEV